MVDDPKKVFPCNSIKKTHRATMENALRFLLLEEGTLFPRGEYFLDEKLIVGMVDDQQKEF